MCCQNNCMPTSCVLCLSKLYFSAGRSIPWFSRLLITRDSSSPANTKCGFVSRTLPSIWTCLVGITTRSCCMHNLTICFSCFITIRHISCCVMLYSGCILFKFPRPRCHRTQSTVAQLNAEQPFGAAPQQFSLLQHVGFWVMQPLACALALIKCKVIKILGNSYLTAFTLSQISSRSCC